MIYKDNDLGLEDLDKVKGIVRHFWNAYGNEDSDGDIITRGSFARSISQRGPKSALPRIKFLWQHNTQDVRGVPQELEERDLGLLATTQIILGRPDRQGEDLLILYAAGGITEHSIGIDSIKRDEADRRVIVEARLWEGSAVTFGANPLTPFVDVKGVFKRKDNVEERLSYLDASIDKADLAINSGISDELAEEFVLWKNLLVAFKSGLAEKHSGRKDPSPDTPSDEDEAAILETRIVLESLKRQRERFKSYA